MSYYNSPDVNKLAMIYEKTIIDKNFYEKIKILEEGFKEIADELLRKSGAKDDFNMKTNMADLKSYFNKKFESDFKKSGQATVEVEDYLKGWLIQNLLIITDVNGNSTTNPDLWNIFRKGEENIQNDPTLYSGSNYFKAYNDDPWIRAVLEDWASKYATIGPGSSSARLGYATVTTDQALGVIDLALEKLKIYFQSTVSADPRTKAPTEENLPFKFLRTDKSKGGTTLGDLWNQAGTGYYGKDVKIISRLPGSASYKDIVSRVTSTTPTTGSYTSPFSNLRPEQIRNAIFTALTTLQSSYPTLNVPPATTPPNAMAQALFNFMSQGTPQATAAMAALFPQLKGTP